MLRTLLVITVGFLPSLFSLWMLRKSHQRTRARMRQVANFGGSYGSSHGRESHSVRADRPDGRPDISDRYYLEGVGYLIGDISCKLNARSGYIRCAVNPSGPCHGCRFYEARELVGKENVDG
ncbi:MAG: hypothetical protein KME64_25660 [Scytonematopsis contorta HA4267-MV1]|nr:hypothetical protein [Scytonematopsis contorta HA4267-MV1]